MKKNTMKKIISIMIVMAVMVSIVVIGYANDYKKGEIRYKEEYEKLLYREGFRQDPYDEDVWVYDGVYEEKYRIKAVYDAYEDMGVIYEFDIYTGESHLGTFKWNQCMKEFDEMFYYDFEGFEDYDE